MGKITKKASEKHRVSLSPAISDFVKTALELPLPQLRGHLSTWPERWSFPRGDFYNWIEVLDRFDQILEDFINRYGLNKGPQVKPFGTELLLEASSSVESQRLEDLGFGPEGDRELIESVLSFSSVLLEKAGNRSLYNSSDRLNDLLNTTSLSLLHATSKITLFLAQRFAERQINPHQVEKSQTQFYSYDHYKLERIVLPVSQSPSTNSKRPPLSPTKSFKSKDKSTHPTRLRRGSSAVNPDDFRSLCRESVPSSASAKASGVAQTPEREWQAWAHVTVKWQPAENAGTAHNEATVNGHPSTPTPARRQASSLSQVSVPGGPDAESQQKSQQIDPESNMSQCDYSASDLQKTDIHSILAQCSESMPPVAKYELLHKLRVAYGLMSSVESRRTLLAVRLLAIATLGNVYKESTLQQKLFAVGLDISHRQHLIQQTLSLVQETNKGQSHVSLYLQTLALEVLGVLARQQTFRSEITTALGPSSSHGILLRLTQRGLADIAQDEDETDNAEGDNWRDAVFSILHVLVQIREHHTRGNSETAVAASLVSSTTSALIVTTGKALRIHLRVLDFIKTFLHEFKDSLTVLSSTQTFEYISTLLKTLVDYSSQQVQLGNGISSKYKTQGIDYEIPYLQQQIIRSVIDLLNDISSHQGQQAERVLRSLVDSQALLSAFRQIITQVKAFGAHTWSETVRALTSFLNNEPTSFTVMNEAGISRCFLDVITSSSSSLPQANVASALISDESSNPIPGLPAHKEAILSAASAFSAICLTTTGLEQFTASNALAKFFEIFESAKHAQALDDPNALAMLGSTFDELVRHHPTLRGSVLDAIVIMLARVRRIAMSMAFDLGEGPKLWLDSASDTPTVCGGLQSLRYSALTVHGVESNSHSQDQVQLQLHDGASLSIRTAWPPSEGLNVKLGSEIEDETTVAVYIKPALGFLSNLFENQTLCGNFMESGATDLVLDLVTVPSFPIITEAAPGHKGFTHEVAEVVHRLAEAKPHLVLPVLGDRARRIAHQLDGFVQAQTPDLTSYFGKLLQPAGERSTERKVPNSFDHGSTHGTVVAKNLTATYVLAFVLADIFHMPIYNTRSSSNGVFSQVNIADIFSELCEKLGKISAACMREGALIRSCVPDRWLNEKQKPSVASQNAENERPERPVGVDGEAAQTSAVRPEPSDQAEVDISIQEKCTARFQNFEVLHFLLSETPKAIGEFLCHLGRGIAQRRRSETISKQKTALVAKSLSSAYLAQLDPPYFKLENSVDKALCLERRFAYFLACLTILRESLIDDSYTTGPGAARQAFVLDIFRKTGGLKALTRIGTEFFNELKALRTDQLAVTAQEGLKSCLLILDDITNSKNITESSQASHMKNSDPNRSFYFVPPQVLLELRMEALPLVKLIWESDYADQASNEVIQRLVSVLKHVLTGDPESEAIQHASNHPTLGPQSYRKFVIEQHKLSSLKEKGYAEDLAQEALYRTNSTSGTPATNAEEYCKAITNNPARRRLPIPIDDADASVRTTTASVGATEPVLDSADTILSDVSAAESGSALANAANLAEDDMMEDVEGTSTVNTQQEHHSAPSAQGRNHTMEISNVLNQDTSIDSQANVTQFQEQPAVYSVDSINAERDAIREDLADRCNNVLNNHQPLVFELAELISSATKKLSGDDTRSFWENTSNLLVTSLLSMQIETDLKESKGQKITAAAHLVALLIQDNEVFKQTLSIFQESFDGLLGFLQLPQNKDSEPVESYPWIAPVLLIVERMLSRDAEPVEITWEPPTDLDSVPELQLTQTTILTLEQKQMLLDVIMKILPAVGKDKSMALSIVRALSMLTRNRDIASTLAGRRNLSGLFKMIKQLSAGVGTRVQSAVMIILRHIIEDNDTIRRIMRSEIIAQFNDARPSRPIDITTYTRDLYHLALRSPDVFVDVTNKLVKLSSWSPQNNNTTLVLKESSKITSDGGVTRNPVSANSFENGQATHSIEDLSDPQETREKANEVKTPVVEHPDGVIHFILSEILAYKDVEDSKVSTESDKGNANDLTEVSIEANPSTTSLSGTQAGRQDDTPFHRHDRPKFRAEDHQHFVYRIFLLQCLTELLYSYNRTKVEFINFSRKADPLAVTPSKPRSGVLNYVLNVLIPSGVVDKDDSITTRKNVAVTSWAIRVVVALCSKTGENGVTKPPQRFSSSPLIDDSDDETELTFVRRFVLEHVIRAFKDAVSSTEELDMKYSRLLCLSELFRQLLSKGPNMPDGAAGAHNSSYKVLGRMMFEKDLISILTSSLAEIDLAYGSAKRVVKFILKPLQELTTLAARLSLADESVSSVIGNTSEDVISSASSVSEVDDEREETPDFFRNSTLGMLDPGRPHESESEEDDEDDEDMYDDEYEEEMQYDEGMPGPVDEVVSDEELEAHADVGPMEGLQGDVPMDLELVVNENAMEENDDDDDTDDDEDDEDDDDDDGEDFEIEMDEGGEMNADDENNSLGEGHAGEEDWEDDDDDEEDVDEGDPEVTFEGEELPDPIADAGGEPRVGDFHELLRVLGEHDAEHHHELHDHAPPNLVVQSAGADEEVEEEDDEDEEDEEAEENEDLVYDAFDEFLNNPDDALDESPWGWDEAPGLHRRHAHRSRGVRMNGFFGGRDGRRIIEIGGGRAPRNPPQPQRGMNDGINPLLQRPRDQRNTQPNVPPQMPFVVPPGGGVFEGLIQGGIPLPFTAPMQISTTIDVGGGADDIAGHGAILDQIIHTLQRGGGTMFRNGRFHIHAGDVMPTFRDLVRPNMPSSTSRHAPPRDEFHRVVVFVPALTVTRWQEDARILFGNTYLEKVQRVQKLAHFRLIPEAQQDEKVRRQKREEERAEAEKRQKDEEERQRKEEAESREREEAEVLERLSREAAERQAEAVAAAAAQQEEESNEDEAMDDAEPVALEPSTGEQNAEGAPDTSEAPRVFTTIRGRQLDITGLAIDQAYLEAIPEDLREEVIMQQYSARREQAQEHGTEATAIDPEFLNALPEDIRDEIRQQEAYAQRRREREEARRQQTTAGAAQAEDMDNDNFLATLDPALRRAILAEQPPEILQQLDPRHAAEGRAHARRLFHYPGVPLGRNDRLEQAQRDHARDPKRQVVQLIDKPGVATLLRLMFMPHGHGSLRQNLSAILRNVCGNRQTRIEVIGLLLVVLKEGSIDVTALERSLASLSLRAKASSTQKTPQPLKRTLSLPPKASLSEDMTPLVVVQQCLSALLELSRHGFHVKSIFLREVDVSSSAREKKGKGKENKSTRFPINDLLGLLERRLVMENSQGLQALAELLAEVTSPLKVLLKKDKEGVDADVAQKSGDVAKASETPNANENVSQDRPETSGTDTSMADAPSVTDQPDATNTAQAQVATDTNEEPSTSTEITKDGDAKVKKSFEPPVIPEHYLKSIVEIFVAHECSVQTFTAAVETLKNLSWIPGTSTVFSQELINHVQRLSTSICADLDELLPLVQEASSSTELQVISSSKFSPGSDQLKLLRVLQALDYLSEPKKDGENVEEATAVKSMLNSSYNNLSLGPLWSKLSDCLSAMAEKDNVISFATILQALIESLMVVCKHTSLKDAPLSQPAKDQAPTTPPPESMTTLEELFFKFTTEHRKILNDIVRHNPKLMQGNGSFALLTRNPKILEFDNKRAYFNKQIHSRNNQQRHPQPPLGLNVRRDQVFGDSFKALYYKSPEEMKYGKLNIRFNGEEGVDAGGVTREWFQVLARGMFDPNWALWEPVAADRTTFHPSKLSWINEQHLVYFKFIGRIIGKALHEGRVLDAHFSRAVYKRMLGKQPNLADLESMDLDYYKSLLWILENDISDVLTEDFSVVEEQFGQETVIDLIPDGRNVSVTEENKKEYVQKLVEYRLSTSVTEQLESFIKGFHDIIPADLVSIFNEKELELLISGLPEIDVDDWRANTEYHNYNASSSQINWFWRVVRGMSNEERAKLLQFVTGTSRVPLEGLSNLQGMNGTTKFSIHRDPNTNNRLPTSHTCFNQLDLPAYDSFEDLKNSLMIAINFGADYFGFA